MSKILEKSYGRSKVLWLLETYIQNGVSTGPFRNLPHSKGDSKPRLNTAECCGLGYMGGEVSPPKEERVEGLKGLVSFHLWAPGSFSTCLKDSDGKQGVLLGICVSSTKGLQLCWPQPKPSGNMCTAVGTTLGQHQTTAVLAGNLLRVSFPTKQTARQGFVLLRGAGKVMLDLISLPSWSTWYVHCKGGTINVGKSEWISRSECFW
jgi:hypothetical protein